MSRSQWTQRRSGFRPDKTFTIGPCGKRTYDGARSAKRSMRTCGGPVRTYFCRQCFGWHVSNSHGSSKKRGGR